MGEDDLCVHATPTAVALHVGTEGMYHLPQLDHELWQQRKRRPSLLPQPGVIISTGRTRQTNGVRNALNFCRSG